MLNSESITLYRRILSYTFKYPLILVTSVIAIALSGAFEAGLFWLLKPILDEGFVGKNAEFIAIMPWLIIAIFLTMSALGFAGNFGMQWVAQKVVMALRGEMYQKLLTLPQTNYDRHPSGSFLSKLTYDVNQLLTISSLALITLIKDTAIILGLLVVMFIQNWKITLMVLTMAPFIYFVLRYVSTRLRNLSRTIQSEMGELNHITEETIRGHREIKLFSAFRIMSERFESVNRRLRQLNMKIMVSSELSSPLSQVLLVICVAVVIWYASTQTVEGDFTVGGFLSLLAAMIAILNPIKRLTRLNEALQRGLAGAEGVFELIDSPSEENRGTTHLTELKGEIEFKEVYFNYEGTERRALNGISLKIEPKETIALVGASGSGKSTFANLLARFYLPTSGEILIDGYPLNTLELENYRSFISYVGQNVILFADTVANNISFGSEDYERAEIIQAAKHANADQFIQLLPKQYDTLIGEDGARLSGGQRQRVAIARALLKDAPILILDEATSSLDSESEYAIQEALKPLSKDKTTIIIAHRLSTIENADKIVVFDQGKIVEMGTHQSLLEANGYYAKLYRINIDEEVN